MDIGVMISFGRHINGQDQVIVVYLPRNHDVEAKEEE